MSQVLYRKYRPQNFSEVVNQQAIKTTLQNAVASSSVAHAYLFTGPRGVGKTTLARVLAKALNCEKPKDGNPCTKCNNCTALSEGHFIDLIEIDAASHTGVDNIREIIEHVKFSPSTGKFKIIVIDEVHMLSKGAFNALLKTLEEPPAHAIFVLATTEIAKVPATIVSRTQKFDFKLISQSEMIRHLEKIGNDEKVKVPSEVLKLVSRASGGSVRDALSIYGQLISFSGGKVTLEQAEDILGLSNFSQNQDFLQLLIDKNLAAAIKFLKTVSENGKDLTLFGNGFLEYLEMVLSQKIETQTAESRGLNDEDFKQLETQVELLTEKDLVRLISLFLQAVPKVRYSAIAELPLELAVIEYLQNGGDDPPPSPGTKNQMKKDEPKKEPEPAQQEKSEAKISTKNANTVDLSEINKKWSQFLNKVKEYNHSLIASLRLCKVVNAKDGAVFLSFPYRFHKEAVEQQKNKIVIEKVLEEIYGQPLRLKCLTLTEEEEYTEGKKPAEGLLTEAIKVFG